MAQVFEAIHKDSCMCGKSELDLFTVPNTQVEMNKGFWEDVDPVSSIGASYTIEFLCAANSDVYTNLANSYIHVKAKITNANGTNLANTAQVGPVNLWMHALFSQVEVYLNNKLVTPSSTSYPYQACMETVLNFSKDAKASHLIPALFYKDEAGKMDVANPPADAADANKRLRERHAHTSESKSVAMEGRIHSDLFVQDRYILGAVPIKIKMIRSRNPFCLVLAADNPDFKVVLEECVFRVYRVSVSSTTILVHTQSFQHITAKYPIDRVNCKVFSVLRGNLSGNEADIFQGPLPDRIVIGMVDADAYNGTYTKNPFNFKNYNKTLLGLTVNDEHLPRKPLQLKFTAAGGKNFVSAHQTLCAGTNKMFQNQGNSITQDEYANGIQCTFLT